MRPHRFPVRTEARSVRWHAGTIPQLQGFEPPIPRFQVKSCNTWATRLQQWSFPPPVTRPNRCHFKGLKIRRLTFLHFNKISIKFEMPDREGTQSKSVDRQYGTIYNCEMFEPYSWQQPRFLAIWRLMRPVLSTICLHQPCCSRGRNSSLAWLRWKTSFLCVWVRARWSLEGRKMFAKCLLPK